MFGLLMLFRDAGWSFLGLCFVQESLHRGHRGRFFRNTVSTNKVLTNWGFSRQNLFDLGTDSLA